MNILSEDGLKTLISEIKAFVKEKAPTKTSQLTNDSGYIKDANLAPYAKTSDVNSKLSTKQNKAIKATITLSTEWTELTQSIPVSGITANDTAILDIVTTTSDYEAQQAEWAKVYKAETYNGGVKFYAKEATTVNLTVQVLAM